MPTDEQWMRRALELASRCAEHGDVPIGAVVVRDDQEIGAAGNERELRRDPTAHAEILAVRKQRSGMPLAHPALDRARTDRAPQKA